MNATNPPRGAQPPQGVPAEGTEQGPHTRTPAPTIRGSRTLTARPVGGQSGEEECMTPDAPRNGRTLRAHLDQVLHTVVLPGLTRLNSEGARLNR